MTVTDRVPVVHLNIGNKDAAFVVDTGAESTILATVAANRLGLHHDNAYPRRVRGFNGGVVSGSVELPNLSAAGKSLGSFRALLGEIQLPTVAGITPDGYLGADILSAFELDLDFVHNQLRLFERSSCTIAAPDWGTAGFTLLEANRSLHDHLFFSVTLDSRRLAAFFDTGAQRSVIDARSTHIGGMSGTALTNGPISVLRGFSGKGGVAVPLFRFHELLVGSIKISDPVFVVAALGLVDGDLVLGMDYLKDQRLWLSYGSHRIFLSKRL